MRMILGVIVVIELFAWAGTQLLDHGGERRAGAKLPDVHYLAPAGRAEVRRRGDELKRQGLLPADAISDSADLNYLPPAPATAPATTRP